MPTSKERYLKQVLESCKQAFYYVAVFSCIVNILMLTVSIYMLQIFDRVFASHNSDTLIYLTVIALFAVAILAVLDFIRARILMVVGQWLDNKLSTEALNRSIDDILHGHSYAPQSLRDVGTLRSFFSGHALLSMLDIPWVPIYIFVIFLLDIWLGIIGLVGAIILFALAVLNEIATRDIYQTINVNTIKTQYHVSSALRNAESIQAMGMLPMIIQRWLKDNQVVLKLQAELSGRSGTILAVSKFFRLAIQIIMLGIGAYLVVTNRLTSGSMIAASIILSRALAPIEQSITSWNQFMNARSAYRRLDDYFEKPMLRTVETTLPKPKGHLTVENVSLAPPGTINYILRGIQFDILPTEMLAIIGPSGAGKTTLARVLVGAFKPTIGNVRLDNADIFTWDRSDIGQYIGYLPQNVELFNGTIKENIARFTECPDEKVIDAGQKAHVHDLILRLPNGYDTVINENMSNLSAGQRQRIGLARALFGDPPLVILDEPNSNLDTEGEMHLAQALIDARKRGITVIFIAHRPNLVQIANKILFLQDGMVKAFGPAQEVLNKLREYQQQMQNESKNKTENGTENKTENGTENKTEESGKQKDSGKQND